jgi:hypothetical protein
MVARQSARTGDERIAKQPMMPINMALRESDILVFKEPSDDNYR